MSFLHSSTSFTRFRIVDPVPSDLWPTIEQRLKQFAFMDIDNTSEERNFGWVCFDNMLDSAWVTAPPTKAEYITFSLRLDTRRIPAAVLKKHTALAMQEEEKRNIEQGKKFISRERKRELREQTKLRLLSRFLPIPAVFNVVWPVTEKVIYFASTHQKVCELFMEQFSQTFDLDLEPLTPYQLAAQYLDEDSLTKLENLQPTQFA